MSNTVNNCTSHPEGMLDRDQRTTFIFKTKSNEMIPLKCTICGCDDFKPNYIDIRRTYLNSNVNCDYLTSKNFSKKKVTRFFQKLNKYLLAIFCIWILTSHQLKTIMAMPIHTSSEYNTYPESLGALKSLLRNPCGYEGTDTTDNSQAKQAFVVENKDVKFYLGKVESSARTGFSDFQTEFLKDFFATDFGFSRNNADLEIINHHEAWKHHFNPNLLPNGRHLDIEFLNNLPEATKLHTEELARSFNVANETHKNILLHILEDCDERLQRLLVEFYQMRQNLNNIEINFRQNVKKTDDIRKVYQKANDVIRNSLCDVRTAITKLDSKPAPIVDVEYIVNNPYRTDSVNDWVNVRQLLDQLKYMTQIFDIWANKIQEVE